MCIQRDGLDSSKSRLWWEARLVLPMELTRPSEEQKFLWAGGSKPIEIITFCPALLLKVPHLFSSSHQGPRPEHMEFWRIKWQKHFEHTTLMNLVYFWNNSGVLYNPGWPWIHSMVQVNLELTASGILRLQVWTSMKALPKWLLQNRRRGVNKSLLCSFIALGRRSLGNKEVCDGQISFTKGKPMAKSTCRHPGH